MDITKEQLEEWRDRGFGYDEIAGLTGLSPKTIGYYVKKYGLSKRKKTTGKDREQFCRMRREGHSTEEIAALTGHSVFTVNKYLKAAGLVPDRRVRAVPAEGSGTAESPMFTPHAVTYAVRRRKRAFRVVLEGKTYIDVTDFEIPG